MTSQQGQFVYIVGSGQKETLLSMRNNRAFISHFLPLVDIVVHVRGNYPIVGKQSVQLMMIYDLCFCKIYFYLKK